MSDLPKARVTFVIPVRNDAVRLRRCLESIKRNTYPAGLVECVVADNGSTDASAEAARVLGATVLSIPGSPVSAVRNKAAAAAAGDLLAFVDADHEIGDAWIAAAVDDFSRDGIGAVGALCLAPPAGPPVQQMYGVLRGRTTGRAETSWLGAGNMVVRRDLFNTLGGFDERLETCEDVELCQRIRAAGRQIIGDERLVNYHLGDPASLRSVFTSERWRGRDNLRVSFRMMPGLRDWPSILTPILQALALVTLAGSVAAAPFVGGRVWPAVAISVIVLLGLSMLRTIRIVVSGRLAKLADLALAFAVATAYDLGRACSLLLPAGHGHRRRTDATRTAGSRA